MFEDPELQDPVSLSLTENYGDQNSLRHELKNAPSSPNYSCETPDIQVIIKEEEEGWTVSQNHENLVSEGESGHTSQHTCHPHIKLCREDGMRRQQASAGRSASATEAQQEDVLVDEKPPRLRYCGRVQEREATVEKAPPCAARETSRGPRGTTHFTERVEPNPEGKQSTSSAEAGLYQRKRSARYHRPASSRAHKTPSANLDDQALHLTVRLHAGEEEEQDEEIGGLINSDGEVVEWDGGESSDQDSESTEVPRPSKGVVQSQSQRGSGGGGGGGGSSSPTLLMEVVSVGDEEEKEEAEDKERAVTRPPAAAAAVVVPPPPPLQRAEKRSRRKKRVVAVTEVSKELSDADQEEDEAPAKSRKRRSRRKISETQLYEAEPGISRRTRGKRAAESGKITPKSSPCAAAKRPYRKRKDVKPSPEGGESTAKKRPGRKMIHVPIEIPPELLKTPKEKVDYHCSVCGKEFPHAYKLERHQLIHTGEKPYCCSICGRGFNQKGNLKTHYKVHFGRKGSVDFDEEVNPLASELSSYLKSLPGESRIRSSLHCLECGKDCESQSALQAHHITTHAHGQPQPDAGAATGVVAEPRADAAGAEPPPDAEEKRGTSELLFCRRCGIQFGDKDKLEEHMRNHVKEKPYSCPDCGKRFINESYIQIHQRLHTGEKPFLCSQCGRSFHTASSLKLHEMQHSGERPFACAICGKKFRINSYLMAHYQTHIKERPFTCGVCGKGYSRAEELKVHHRLHTGERPYECGECGKSFIYRQGLRQHQRTHAGKRIGPTRQLGRPKQQARLDI